MFKQLLLLVPIVIAYQLVLFKFNSVLVELGIFIAFAIALWILQSRGKLDKHLVIVTIVILGLIAAFAMYFTFAFATWAQMGP